jgi:hypothetical protein
MCSCDGEYPEFYVPAEWREARRVHRCEECGGGIQLGELHRYGRGRFEGEFYDWRMCARCDALHRAHTAAQATFGDDHCRAPLGELRSTIRECSDENRGYSRALQVEFRKLRGAA